MARTNKYTSLNFNDIYEKKITTANTNTNHHPSPSFNKTLISNSRIHGNMLVLTRPSPKPTPPPPPPSQTPVITDRPSIEPPDSISLRPLGRTAAGFVNPPLPHLTLPVALPASPNTSNKFVPPHLRPGFHGKEEKPEPEIQKPFGSPIQGRPKSGGGYERVRDVNLTSSAMNRRPRSSGSNRPYSSG